VVYHGCTDVGSKGKPWCFTKRAKTPAQQAKAPWGFCPTKSKSPIVASACYTPAKNGLCYYRPLSVDQRRGCPKGTYCRPNHKGQHGFNTKFYCKEKTFNWGIAKHSYCTERLKPVFTSQLKAELACKNPDLACSGVYDPGCDQKGIFYLCKLGGLQRNSRSSCIYTLPTAILYKGESGCNSTHKCSNCQGDCDRNSDCMAGLRCFQRGKHGRNKVPGCLMNQKNNNRGTDFCYTPGVLVKRTRAPTRACKDNDAGLARVVKGATCKIAAKLGYCKTEARMSKRFCPLSCMKCPHLPKHCKDKSKHCKQYKKECKTHKVVQDSCCRTCNGIGH